MNACEIASKLQKLIGFLELPISLLIVRMMLRMNVNFYIIIGVESLNHQFLASQTLNTHIFLALI